MRLLLPLLVFTTSVSAQNWSQWGANARHDSSSDAVGQNLARVDTEIVLDPFADISKAQAGGPLLVHYPVPLVEGTDVFLLVKSGTFSSRQTPESQIWNVRHVRRSGRDFVERWTYTSDWKPVPIGSGGPSWEPVYHTALTPDAVWAPGAGGTIDKINRETGTLIARFNPFGTAVDPTIFTAGPPTADESGNIYYTAIQLAPGIGWTIDSIDSWLIKVAANGAVAKATFVSLTPNAPHRDAPCTWMFTSGLPFPPSRTAIAPAIRCGPQRPGVNVAPAVAPDGTIYVVSRAHLNDRWGYLVAVNPNLTPKWASSMRNRFADGCNVAIPPNGTAGGCRADAITGVDPTDNQLGSGRVNDNSTSSPVVTPDGKILYGAYTRYNYSQGHLMMFDANGAFVAHYGNGWDLTPAIWRHDGTYSVLLKENRYGVGSYCFDPTWCPSDRTHTTPNDPESYSITQLSSTLHLEWKFRNTETQNCRRDATGALSCFPASPWGFEWCVNAIAVDRRGVVYANAEDGYVYAIEQGGLKSHRLFLQEALGAAYTPLSIGSDGRIYTQNNGILFVVSGGLPSRRRSVSR
jgi:hypothetical protein